MYFCPSQYPFLIQHLLIVQRLDWCLTYLYCSNFSWKISLNSLLNKHFIKFHLFFGRSVKEKVTIYKQLWMLWNVISLKYILILDNSAAELQGMESNGLTCNQTETKFKQDQDFIYFFFLNYIVYFRQIFFAFSLVNSALVHLQCWSVLVFQSSHIAWLYQHCS